MGRQRPARVGGVAFSRAHRPGQRRRTGDQSSEPGNQLAGYDARYTYRLGGGRSVSIYGQAIGEDEANSWPSHFLVSVGADLALPIGGANVRFFVEHANTTARDAFGKPQFGAAYRHHIYTDGYTQLGDPLGHPAWGDARLTSVGVYRRPRRLDRRLDAASRLRLPHRAALAGRRQDLAARTPRSPGRSRRTRASASP